MFRPSLVVSLAASLYLALAQGPQRSDSLQWIWYPEGDPRASAPIGARYFRRAFEAGDVEKAVIEITADNAFELFLNGESIGTGDDWARVRAFDVKARVRPGKNVVAV